MCILRTAFVTGMFLAGAFVLGGCAARSTYVSGYSSGADYDYNANRPTVEYHNHYGNVVRVYEIGLPAVVTTGTVLNELTRHSFPTAEHVALRSVVDVRLHGGGLLSVVQDGAPKFYVGQPVAIEGTGMNVRIVRPDVR